MKIEVRGKTISVTDGIRRHAVRRARFALSRFTGRVERVTLRIDDANGPRGGIDKVCRVRLLIRGGQAVVLTEVDRDLYAAIDSVVDRAARAVSRRLDREWTLGPMSPPRELGAARRTAS